MIKCDGMFTRLHQSCHWFCQFSAVHRQWCFPASRIIVRKRRDAMWSQNQPSLSRMRIDVARDAVSKINTEGTALQAPCLHFKEASHHLINFFRQSLYKCPALHDGSSERRNSGFVLAQGSDSSSQPKTNAAKRLAITLPKWGTVVYNIQLGTVFSRRVPFRSSFVDY